MCGIFVSCGSNVSFSNHEKLSKLLYHRGPDNQTNLRIHDKLIFGHTRLSIIDLNNISNQPFRDEHSIIIFNGLIYNYLEIKKKLTKFYNFKTQSDTEVISAAYSVWKKDCFKHLNGMFSIVIYDLKTKEIIVARDRLGIKPLYYRQFGGNLYLSSEIKPLLKLGNYRQDFQAIYNYFQFSFYEDVDKTFFEEVKQFQPNHYYVIKNNKISSKKCYWDLKKKINTQKKINSLEEAKNFFSLHFDRVSDYYSRSDRKIGLLYSSGLDSNFILNLLNKKQKNISLLLTFGFEAKNLEDEIAFVKNNAIENFIHRFKIDEFLYQTKKIQIEQEMPWGGPNVFFQGYLMQKAKDFGHRVVLSADGADEIFGGYNKYLNLKKVDAEYVNRAIDNSVPYHADIFKKKFNLNKKTKFNLPNKNNFDCARYIDITFSKLPRNFRFSDRYSMSKSIELRYPFLDHELIEASFTLNKKLMINNNENKIIMRQFFKNNRKKKHINSPQTEWFYDKKFKKIMSKICDDSPIFEKVLDKKKIKNYYDYFYKKKRNNSFKMWQIYNYDLWLKTFF